MNGTLLNDQTVLITGVAGFIGSYLAKRLLTENTYSRVIGIDNLNDYYDVNLKRNRLKTLLKFNAFTFIKGNIADKRMIADVFATYQPCVVINLAAQAGVRHSISHPDNYIESNIIGFYNILEACRHSYDNGQVGVRHLVYASSSSIYGNNCNVPYSTHDKTDCPVSLYAATKKSNELMAYAYSVLYNIPSTGLRFFTVYGPAGRPDMAYFSFTQKLLNREKIQLFNYGNCKRDFTYIDDVVTGICKVIGKAPGENSTDHLSKPPHAIYNIGNSHPETLLNFIDILAQELIRVGLLPLDFDLNTYTEPVAMQPGDVTTTYAEMIDLERDFGFRPSTPLRYGIRKFTEWYRNFYSCPIKS